MKKSNGETGRSPFPFLRGGEEIRYNEREESCDIMKKTFLRLFKIVAVLCLLYLTPLLVHYARGMVCYFMKDYERACHIFVTCNNLPFSMSMAQKCREKFYDGMVRLDENGNLKEDDLLYYMEEAVNMDLAELEKNFDVPVKQDGNNYKYLKGTDQPLLGMLFQRETDRISRWYDVTKERYIVSFYYHSTLVSEAMTDLIVEQLRMRYGKEAVHREYTGMTESDNFVQRHQMVWKDVTLRYTLPSQHGSDLYLGLFREFCNAPNDWSVKGLLEQVYAEDAGIISIEITSTGIQP